MRSIDASPEWLHGAVSLERIDGGLKAWRIPYDMRELFPPDALNGRAEEAAGIRLELISDTTRLRIVFQPIEAEAKFVCSYGGENVVCRVAPGGREAMFADLPPERKRITVYFPQNRRIVWQRMDVDNGAFADPFHDSRKRWVAYGSSITQGCSIAVTPLPMEMWTAAASAVLDMQLYNLGFGGNCHHEPMMARLIRDLPAELISLCFGINVMGGCTLNDRTFQPSVLGFIQTVRDGHPETPIVILSPIYAPSRERTKNQVGLDLRRIRSEIAEAVHILQMRGDRRLILIHGTELLGESEEGYLPDGIHPDARGHSIMANRFVTRLRELGMLVRGS